MSAGSSDQGAVAWRTLIAATTLLAVSVLGTRVVTTCFDPLRPGVKSSFGLSHGDDFNRYRAVARMVPSVAERPEKSVLAIGSSEVCLGFNPVAFDTELRARSNGARFESWSSYNFGLQSMVPETELLMARRLQEVYTKRRQKIGVSFIQLSPDIISEGAHKMAHAYVPHQALPFQDWKDLASNAKAEPRQTLRDAVNRYVFATVPPAIAGDWVSGRLVWGDSRLIADCEVGFHLRSEKQWSDEIRSAMVSARAENCRQLSELYPNGLPVWDPAIRGAPTTGLPATQSSFDELRRIFLLPEAQQKNGEVRRSLPAEVDGTCTDDAIDTQVSAARTLANISDRTYLVVWPVNWGWSPPGTAERWEKGRNVIERVAKETGLPVLDYSHSPDFSESDFFDSEHLHYDGEQKLSKLLAARLAADAAQN
jgi:hypothetical protein